MQFYQIDENTRLSELSELVGTRNVDQVLHVNELTRTPLIGKQYIDKCNQTILSSTEVVNWQKKSSILNQFVSDSDIFETAALAGESTWKLLSAKGALPNYIKIPDLIPIPDSIRVLGNKQGVNSVIYKKTMDSLEKPPHSISPSLFNEYSSIQPSQYLKTDASSATLTKVFEGFNIPWGEIQLYSSLAGHTMDIPAYPEEVSDSFHANYTEMPELLYQYEPWPIYTSSGPRSNSYTFNLHRDMWGGDHRQGGANRLIRFCEANCYPEYNGSAVNTSTVALYVSGKKLTEGIMKDVEVNWDGPIGLDGWYLHFTLTITIQEISSEPLSFEAMQQKGVIG